MMSRGQNEEQPHWLSELITKNIFVILCGIAVIYSSYNSSNAVAAEKFRMIERSIDEIKSEVRNLSNGCKDAKP